MVEKWQNAENRVELEFFFECTLVEQSLPNSILCALACLVSLIFSLVEGARYLSTANPTNFNVTKETVFKQAACMEYQLIVFLISGFFLV